MLKRLAARLREMSGGLGFRLLIMLTLALVPLGAIAVIQNNRAESEAQRSAETALLGLTFESVSGELALIQSAFGSADALGSVALDKRDDPGQCDEALADFVETAGLFIFAGFTDPEGAMLCASEQTDADLSDAALFERVRERDEPVIERDPDWEITDRSALVIASPVKEDDGLAGFVIFALPLYAMDFVREFGQEREPTYSILFTPGGDVIGAAPGDEDITDELPDGRDLGSFADGARSVLRLNSAGGDGRTYTVVPLIEERLYALGIWSDEDLPSRDRPPASSTLGFAVLVWLVSLGVAYLAAHRLVIRHVRRLGAQMRRFAHGAHRDPPEIFERAPDEIRELSATFREVAEVLAHDEAQLEASVSEKTVLLRELHHRVKNNLQLIASIISIQMRQVRSAEARALLHGLHERVMTLATIHERLYQSDRLSALRADELLEGIVGKLVSMSVLPDSDIAVETRFDPVTLDPDQVVPLSLLATEALINALKYVARPEGGAARIDVRLTAQEGDVVLEIVNSCVTAAQPDADGDGRLGHHLIRAFSAQLDTEAEQGPVETPDGPAFRVALRFRGARRAGEDPAG